VLTDLAVMIADGGECISDIATLVDQPGVFGSVASDTTCWRVLDAVTARDLDAVDAARGGAGVGLGPARRSDRHGVAGLDGRRCAATRARWPGGVGDRRGRHPADRAL